MSNSLICMEMIDNLAHSRLTEEFLKLVRKAPTPMHTRALEALWREAQNSGFHDRPDSGNELVSAVTRKGALMAVVRIAPANVAERIECAVAAAARAANRVAGEELVRATVSRMEGGCVTVELGIVLPENSTAGRRVRIALKNPVYVCDRTVRIVAVAGVDLGQRGPIRYIEADEFVQFRGGPVRLDAPVTVRLRAKMIAFEQLA